jgi:hypothetical protein
MNAAITVILTGWHPTWRPAQEDILRLFIEFADFPLPEPTNVNDSRAVRKGEYTR